MSLLNFLTGAIGGGGQPPHDDPNEAPPITVEGDAWHPRKATLLGTLADAFLAMNDEAPAFQINRDKRSMEEAMKGFTHDPMRSIRRVGMMDPKSAWSMYNTQQDNDRQAGTQHRIERNDDQKYEDTVMDRALGMMGAANEKNYPAIKDQVTRYLSARNVTPPFSLPDKYDPDTIKSLRYGTIPGAKQVQLEEMSDYHDGTLALGRDRVDQQARTAQSQEEYRNARLGQMGQTINNAEQYRQARLGQMGAAGEEAGRHNRVMEARPVKGAKGASGSGGKGLPDNPTQGQKVLSPDNKRIAQYDNGRWRYFKKVDGKVVEIGN